MTGLVLHDTASYWSMFGQAVILFLIQIGGMGVVICLVAVAIFSGRKISLMQRSTMRESISAPQVGGIVRMTEFILKTVFLVELLELWPWLQCLYGILASLRESGMPCSTPFPPSATRASI